MGGRVSTGKGGKAGAAPEPQAQRTFLAMPQRAAAQNWLGIKSLVAACGSWAALFIFSALTSPMLMVTPVLYTGSESIFALYTFWKWRSSSSAKADFPASREEAWSTFHKTLDVVTSYYDAGDWLSQWFKGVPLSAIRRGNALDLLAHALWHQDR